MTKAKGSVAWRPVKLEGSVLADGVDGLIGIEELTDYKLEKSNRKSRIIVCKEKTNAKPKLKRKPSEHWQEEDIQDSEPSPKKANSTKRRKQSGQSKAAVNLAEENGSDGKTDSEDSPNPINVQAWSALGVPEPVIKALADQNFHSPTMIQSLTLAPAILGRRDILGAAETGSGKTLAFGIPIINGILELKRKRLDTPETESGVLNNGWICTGREAREDDESGSEEETVDENGLGCVRVVDKIELGQAQTTSRKPLYALILTPTRELAIQIKDHLTKAAKYTDIRIAVVLGGMAAVKQERILSKGPEIVIATPGRLWELIQQGNPHLSQVNSIKYLAIDETDRMLEKGHFQELQQLLEKINLHEKDVRQRQTFVFSATLTMVHELPDYLQRIKRKFAKSKIYKLTPGQKLQKIIHLLGIKNPKIVDVTREKGTASNLTECRIACTIDHKDYYLYYFLKRHEGRTLVFCNSIGCVKRLATLFAILECKPLPLHAGMPQRQRLKNLERFQAEENGLLIATDVAARGLDIPKVEHVIHYQVPRTSESYVHRSGRTARAEQEGITVLMMEPSEKQNYSKLCKTLGRTQDLPAFPVVDRLLIAVKERVDVAREIDKLELRCRRDNSEKGWLKKAVEEMDMVLEEDQEEETAAAMETADLKRLLKGKRRQLASLLNKPVFPRGFSGKYPDTNLSINFSEDNRKAVDLMKTAIEEAPKKKRENSKMAQKKRNLSTPKGSKKHKRL